MPYEPKLLSCDPTRLGARFFSVFGDDPGVWRLNGSRRCRHCLCIIVGTVLTPLRKTGLRHTTWTSSTNFEPSAAVCYSWHGCWFYCSS